MNVPAISGPTDIINSRDAITTIQTTIGRRMMLMPRARSTKGVTMKLMPPISTAVNSSASPTAQRLMPQLTPVSSVLALRGA